ncbi:MAG: DNA/RNA nuclease SfsA, partial [Symploca sp. SIO3C6]|nr:DNA/RNA nuclease SfsA [Symploca sp. SIO3C6]
MAQHWFYPFSPLSVGRLLKRYKRFLADIELDSGGVITAHCPNTGPMTGVCQVGNRVMVSKSTNPKRKLAYTWELIEVDDN